MTDSQRTPETPDAAGETQQQRATETMQLSNEFTDRQVARLRAAVTRRPTP